MPRSPELTIALSALPNASAEVGSSMKKPTNREGWRATALATELSSPGTLAINAACDLMAIELARPSIGKLLRRAWRLPSELSGDLRHGMLCSRWTLTSECLEELFRKEMNVRVVHDLPPTPARSKRSTQRTQTARRREVDAYRRGTDAARREILLCAFFAFSALLR
jgi:hypothetical protein